MKIIVALLLVLTLAEIPQMTLATEPPETVFIGNEWRVDSDSQLEYLKARRQERLGNVLFGTGFGLAILGTFLVESDPWGGVGKTGFASVGSGIAVMVSGMFLLSFPIHRKAANHEHH